MISARGFWTDEKLGQLIELASSGAYAAVIARTLGCSLHSVMAMAGRNNITLVRYSPQEQAVNDEMNRKRWRAKKARRQAAKRSERVFIPDPKSSKTGPIFRNSLPKAPEMSVNQRRAFLAEAFRNTAEASHGSV